ncbi:flagellar hook-length control protein FliK [Phyllobacterium sp. SB3]|uniref:flagellar hook-length control protein FliK n=1 Tax=Phyllobacterium sp. SB3 TaxID=3156073 RepID=UPI0032AEF391
MTIGTNMPFKLKFQALIRSAGKEDVLGDLKGIPDNKETAADFGVLLKAVTTKQKTDAKHNESDEEIAGAADPRGQDEQNSKPAEQGLFTQPIIALEQMLDRRQHGEEALAGAAKGEPTTAIISVTTSGEAEPAVPGEDLRQEVQVAATVPQEQKRAPVKADERPAKLSGPWILSIPAQTQAVPESQVQLQKTALHQEAGTLALTASAVEMKSETPDSKPVAAPQEVINVADKDVPLPNAASLPQATKQSIANIAFVANSASRPAITDIQVVSDRTVGAARTLVIQLQPVELGAVTARLRLTSGGMHIQIDAATTAMAEHLSNDREALGKALHRAGVTDDVSTVTISVVDRSTTGSSANQTGQHNPGAQDQQMGARGNNQGQSGFQNTPRDRSAEQQFFGEAAPDDKIEKLAKTDVQSSSSRGLVV